MISIPLREETTMALIKCKECRKEVSTKAEVCPHCGARIKEKTGYLSYIIVGTFLVLILSALFSNDTDSTLEEPTVLKNLKTDAETQKERTDLMQDMFNKDLFKKIEKNGTYPHVHVGDTFYNLSFDQKQQFISVVFAYFYSQSKESDAVFINDYRNGKRVGMYSVKIGGLKLKGSLPMFGEMVDVPLADSFIKRNAIGVLRLPYGREESEQYLKRLEKRKGLVG